MPNTNSKMRITPSSPSVSSYLKEHWKYRTLIFEIARADLKAKYRGTLLGVLWYILQPLLITVAMLLMFDTHFFKSPLSETRPSFLIYFSASMIYGYFFQCFESAFQVFRSYEGIFRKSYVPGLIFPIAQSFSRSSSVFIQLILYSGFAFYAKNSLTVHSLFIFLILILYSGSFGLFLGTLLAGLSVYIRDLHQISQYMGYLLFLSCPIFYSTANLSRQSNFLMQLNPVAYSIEASRFQLFQISHPLQFIFGFSTWIIILILSIFIFQHAQRSFHDHG